MTRKSFPQVLFSLCFIVFVLTIAAIERPAAAQCNKPSEKDIVDKVYAEIMDNKSLAGQVKHINVMLLTGQDTLKLFGWVYTQTDYDKVQQIVLSNCYRANMNEFDAGEPEPNGTNRPLPGGGCQDGFKQCGDICILEGDSCNIKP